MKTKIKRNKLRARFCLAISAALLAVAAGCGGKSDMIGENVLFENVCAQEKWKPIAVEGYLAASTPNCKKGKKQTSSVQGCTYLLHANSDLTGRAIPVYIQTNDSFSGKNNRLGESGEIYDNDANPIPPQSKIRVHGTLPKSEVCEISLAQRIDRVS